MKVFMYLCILVLVGYSMAASTGDIHPRGCIYILGRCARDCEEGTHSFTTGCNYVTPEATCDNPEPVEDTRWEVCDYSACYCDAPTVRDTVSNKCVPIDQCPKKE